MQRRARYVLVLMVVGACGQPAAEVDTVPWGGAGSTDATGPGATTEPDADDAYPPAITSASAGSTSTDGGSDGDETSDESTAGMPPLPCDPGFSFDPEALGSGSLTYVSFTAPRPLTWVEVVAEGPGVAQWGSLQIEGGDPWTWTWPVTDLAPGQWTFSFSHGDPAQTIATCQRWVSDTGLPPPLPGEPPPPDADCGPGQVCGDVGPGGGTCDVCPMVGACLDPASPYGPGGPGPWSCLDSAGCAPEAGMCQIWCPGEPCNEEAHPDGCPQGVEACFVFATYSSYEEACRSCCESRFHEPTGEFACWDAAYSLCRYPTDCGLPLW